jgi:hypothetical protein
MSIKLTEADLGRIVRARNGKIGILEKHSSELYPFRVRWNPKEPNSCLHSCNVDGQIIRSTKNEHDVVEFLDLIIDEPSLALPSPRLKVDDLVTFLDPSESGVPKPGGDGGYYHGGTSLKGVVGKITTVHRYIDSTGCFDVSVTFKRPNGSDSNYLMLEKEFEDYHNPSGKPSYITMFEEAGKFPDFSPSPKSDITIGTKIVPIACTNSHNYKLNKVYEVVKSAPDGRPDGSAFVCKDPDGKQGNIIRPKDFRIVGIRPEVGDIIEAVANDNDHNYAFGKHYVVCAINDRSVRAIDENAKLGNYLRFSNLHIVKKASKSTGEILVRGIKVEQPKTQKTQNSISHEIYRLPQAIIRREDLQGTAAVGKTTRIAIELGHLSYRVCSGE